MPDVEVGLATPQERVAVENLLQLYIHDFSEQWAGLDEPRGEVDEAGRFLDYPLDAYWSEPDHAPLLIRAGGRLAGFALLDAHSHSGSELDRNMAEFFVLRKYRRGGIGTAAAQGIFSLYPGRWEAAVARRNTSALPFWRKAVATHPKVESVEELDLANAAWNGAVLRFRISG